MSAVVIGAVVTALGLLGLILSAGAIDSGMHHFGIGLFGFAVLYVFWLVKKHFDEADTAR